MRDSCRVTQTSNLPPFLELNQELEAQAYLTTPMKLRRDRVAIVTAATVAIAGSELRSDLQRTIGTLNQVL